MALYEFLNNEKKVSSKNLDLNFLNLGVNNLDYVPDWISSKQYEVLKLHKNNIRVIPFIDGKKLKFLNLYQNKMDNIPNWIWDLKNLEFFSWGFSK